MGARITANGDRVELYVPLTKFDERTGEFEAWATLEELDAHGEICDVEKSWPALVAHAQEQSEFSDGKSVGNLRRQHRRDSAVGKLTKLERAQRRGVDSVFVKGKVTDAQTKLDATEGVVTGISLRGMASRWPDPEHKDAKRYAWTLVEEYSIVDRPAVPHALIEVMKSSGEIEMVKAVGRPVTQYWDCFNPACQSKHSRKEEAQKCETPEDEALPSSVEATQKAAGECPNPTHHLRIEGVAIEPDVILEKCLGCVAELGWLIQHATQSRPPQECSGCNCSPCGGPPCASYIDPGHEEMEAGVKQLWDAMRAMVADLRAKWMKEEGVTEEAPLTAIDVTKMLDALSSRLRDTNEVLKSLRVPTGNGSSNNKPKEGTMDTKKEEGVETPATDPKVDELMTKVDTLAAKVEECMGICSTLSAAVAELQASMPKPDAEPSEAQKAAATKLETLEKTVGDVSDTVKSLAEIIGNLPTQPKGTLRPVKKEDDGAPPVDTTKSEGGNPFVTKVTRIA